MPGLPNNMTGASMQLLERSFKDIFLNESEISYISCNQKLFDKLVILNDVGGKQQLEKVYHF